MTVHGTLVVAAPCAKCPFRRDVPVYLREDRRREIVQGLMDGAEFWCHQTVDYTTDDEPSTTGSAACAGAAKMLALAGGSTQLGRIAERLGARVPTRDVGAPPWTVEEFQHVPEGAVDDGTPESEYAPGKFVPPYVETCSVVGAGCLAPAGYMGVGGGVVRGTVAAENRCGACDEPVCDNCISDAGLCEWCAEAEGVGA